MDVIILYAELFRFFARLKDWFDELFPREGWVPLLEEGEGDMAFKRGLLLFERSLI